MRPRRMFADPSGLYLHEVVLDACRRHADREALIDASLPEPRRITYREYADLVERFARGLVAAGVRPGEVVGIFLPNTWEFCVAFHGTQLAGATPTLLNPSYREREVRYQLENSGAVALITDGPLIHNMDLSGLPLRRVYTIRQSATGADAFDTLLAPNSAELPAMPEPPDRLLAALPYSSGTTGLPKGVMLSHTNLVANVFQILVPDEAGTMCHDDVVLGFLPLYHIYGLNVVLSPVLVGGGRIVLVQRFDMQQVLRLIVTEGISFIPLVPPVLNGFLQVAEAGMWPRQHHLRHINSGAAPLAPDLPRRFTELTGITCSQGYGMTEASPVTHMGFNEKEWNRPDTIGHPVPGTECRIVDENGRDVPEGEIGELIIRGPQIMLGYWQAPEATAAVLRDGWYYSGDIARRDRDGYYQIVDRRKEMIKYKGFPVAPAEVEAVLMEHPEVRDAGVVGRSDTEAGEIPLAFIVLKNGGPGSPALAEELQRFVADRLARHKQPRDVRFVASLPRTPSGKILRRNLKDLV